MSNQKMKKRLDTEWSLKSLSSSCSEISLSVVVVTITSWQTQSWRLSLMRYLIHMSWVTGCQGTVSSRIRGQMIDAYMGVVPTTTTRCSTIISSRNHARRPSNKRVLQDRQRMKIGRTISSSTISMERCTSAISIRPLIWSWSKCPTWNLTPHRGPLQASESIAENLRPSKRLVPFRWSSLLRHLSLPKLNPCFKR